MELINQDLARWSRGQWFWAVAFIFCVQMAVVWQSRPVSPRVAYPMEPSSIVSVGGAGEIGGEWVHLEDPMLFAAPGWHGVSALAWMRKPAVSYELPREFPALHFLPYGGAKDALGGRPSEMPARIAAHQRPAPEPTFPVLPPPGPEPVSHFAFEGFGGRRLSSLPVLPVQLFNDVVSRTVVQAAIDPDGFVVSSRVTQPSGSKRADADALAITRGLRFEPVRGLGDRLGDVVWGKLIFEWHALDLSRTNAVRQP